MIGEAVRGGDSPESNRLRQADGGTRLGRSGDADAARLQLDRDLKMAISEYAPGSEIVAAKALWRSEGLRVQPGREWPKRVLAVC